MKHYLIAERYAKGLSESIEDTGQLESALAAMEGISAVYAENRDLRSTLSNPAVNVEERAGVLNGVMGGEDAPELVLRLLDLLLRRGRISLVADVTEVFSGLVDERLNRIGAKVSTAAPLDEGRRERLAAALEGYFKKTIRMRCEVDPELLGGVVARVGSVVVDGSVRNRLERLKSTLLSKEQ